jgi:hypothetical protein
MKSFYSDFTAPFKARFIGENSYDAGGPFRDIMENICEVISNLYLKPTSNMESLGDVSSYQPRLLTGTEDSKRFLFIGKMIGWAIQQTTYNLSLDFNVIFWKKLC